MVARQARAVATRQAIIDAGVEVFGDVGYGDTDMTDVVRRANTSGGTCYYYFPTKSSLAEAIVEQANLKIAAAVGSLWDSDAPTLHKIITATYRFIAVTENDPIARVGYQLRQNVRRLSRVQSGGAGDTHVLFAAGIKRAVADGHVRADVNHREAGQALVAAVVGSRLLADAFGDDPFERMTASWRTILRAIAPEDALPALNRYVRKVARAER